MCVFKKDRLPQWLSGKNPSAKAGDAGSILGQKYPLEKETATHSRSLAWEIPWTEEPGGPQSVGLQKNQSRLSN